MDQTGEEKTANKGKSEAKERKEKRGKREEEWKDMGRQ